MKLFELFEKADNIKSKDPRVIQTLLRARSKYHGSADDDLGALVSMMGDEQQVQDKELNSLDIYNKDQDVEIDDNERVNNDQESELNDLRDRINKLQNRPVREENDTKSFDDWVELVILTGSQDQEMLMSVVMGGDEDTALHMYLKDIAHELDAPEHMWNKIAYQAANRIPIPDAATNQQLHQSAFESKAVTESKPIDINMQELIAQIKRMGLFASHISDVEEEFKVNNGETFVALAKKVINAVNAVRKSRGKVTEDGKPETTSQNPLVVVWDHEQGPGMLGHMNLSTAASIAGFEMTPGLAAELGRLGTHRRIRAGKNWLEYSEHNAKYF